MSNASELFGGGNSAPKKWVSGANYTEGTPVWAPADYQYYMRKTTGAGVVDPSADPTNWQPTGDRAVKSIQRGVGAPTATSLTIAAVNTSKTTVNLIGFGWDTGGVVKAVLYGYLSSPTNIVVNGNANYYTGGGFSYEVVERY